MAALNSPSPFYKELRVLFISPLSYFFFHLLTTSDIRRRGRLLSLSKPFYVTCEYTSDGVIDVMEFWGGFDFCSFFSFFFFWFFITIITFFPYRGYYGIVSGIWLWVHQFFFLSVEGNLDFGGLLAKETLPGFGFLGHVCRRCMWIFFFGELWTHGGVFSTCPLFFFCQRHGQTVIYGPVKLLLIKPTGRERTGLWILHVQTAKYPCPM